ncbi:Von Willebrand factor type A domain protein [Bifidobacterium actinocoloniiforme DSM 22766]|uniref:von Willebrand factor type A domain protein n=1 Tax=Bifidobacterium actinocoloniiforme DSM 22766 TaxID=1437605 RepID=A0A086Z175_9BIFI|nr:VWA domain-containing protein [Bifidobacterium actinocoloniiforme]AKV55439.1 von Willebrand factor type A domain protein [Bifidobacterium actinocoloniiforme DSM 22766]KFI40275.1 Von Willebrand factor type A domain protein [Bifidobacterium actinocoloniiforme DSM 22766]
MNGWTLAPSLGWIAGGVLTALLLAAAVCGPILRYRQRASYDASWLTVGRRSLIALVMALIVLTPSQVQTTRNQAVNATDVYVAVDVTGSMAVQDAHYGSQDTISRLDAAKRAVSDITQSYPDASFAAVRFGSSGTLDLPLTPDGRALGNWARNLTTEPTDLSAGSSLDAPLDPLVLSLKETKDRHPDDRIVLYLITDGEQTSAKSRRSFSTLRAYLDDAFTLGVGSAQGGKVPVSSRTPRQGAQTGAQDWVKDPATGQPGISKMDEGQLKAMADEMSGHYLPIDASHTLKDGPAVKTAQRYRVQVTHGERTRVTPCVWPLALILLALLAWEMVDWIRTSRRLL